MSDAELFDPPLEAALRDFQAQHGLATDGALGPGTLAALNVPVSDRITQIRVNLERGRWLLHELDPTFVVVNVAGFQVYYIRDGQLAWSAHTVSRQAIPQDAALPRDDSVRGVQSHLDGAPGILAKDILPAVRRDPGYLARKRIDVVDRSGRSSRRTRRLERRDDSSSARATVWSGQRAGRREVHVPEYVFGIPARHAEQGALPGGRSRLQLGLHPRGETARARRAAAARSAGLGSGRHRCRRTTRHDAHGFTREARARAAHVLDRVGRGLGHVAVSQGRVRARRGDRAGACESLRCGRRSATRKRALAH